VNKGRLRLLLTTDAVGGVWTYSLDLALGLARLGIETVLAVMGPPPTAAQRQNAARIPGLRLVDTGEKLDWLASGPSEIEEAGRAVIALARKHQVDLVQLHTPALAAATAFPVPLVAVVHSSLGTWWQQVKGPGAPMPDDFAWRSDALRLGLANADVVVAPTAAFAAMVQRCYGLSSLPQAVHNGRTPFAPGAQAPHDFIFTSGRLWDEGKNVATLDAAAGKIAVPFHAAGPLAGPNGDRVAVEHLNCLGTLDEAGIAQWLGARPVFASAALYEPFGLSVLEAAAAGCALILSDIPTFRELWQDAAIFVDPRDPTGFARACSDLVADEYERVVKGRAAMERAALYTPDSMAAHMADLYRRLLPGAHRPPPAARAA
jgi:glycosyltransferase involved in cell wall biosynthesis